MADGKDIELKAAKVLEAQGYVVHHCMKTVVRTKAGPRTLAEDVFGCVDLIAKNGGQTRWIQVTSGRNIGDKVDDLAAVPWNDAHDSVEIWRWVGGRAQRDRRYRTSTLRPRQYFQVYRRSRGFALDKQDRVFVRPTEPGLDPAARGGVAQASDEPRHRGDRGANEELHQEVLD